MKYLLTLVMVVWGVTRGAAATIPLDRLKTWTKTPQKLMDKLASPWQHRVMRDETAKPPHPRDAHDSRAHKQQFPFNIRL